MLNHAAFTHRKIHHEPPQRKNSFAWLNGNISHRVLERGAHDTTATNKRAIVCWLGNPVRDTFNVPYDLFPPLLIKLLITFGCYGHQGDIPQVLSATWAQKNPQHGTSIPLSVSLSFFCHYCYSSTQRSPTLCNVLHLLQLLYQNVIFCGDTWISKWTLSSKCRT